MKFGIIVSTEQFKSDKEFIDCLATMGEAYLEGGQCMNKKEFVFVGEKDYAKDFKDAAEAKP